MRKAGMIEISITTLKTERPPKRSVSMPSGMRPRLPSRTGIATAMLFSTEERCICLLRIGIIADNEPKTAKQKAKAPVPKASWSLGEDCDCMWNSLKADGLAIAVAAVHIMKPQATPLVQRLKSQPVLRTSCPLPCKPELDCRFSKVRRH